MNKMHLMLALCAIGCRPPEGQDAASPDESGGVAADGSGAGMSSEQSRTIDFGGERYSLGRAYVSGTQTVNEYYRQGESVAAWQQVITVTDYRGATDLKGFTTAYTDSLGSSGLAVNKDSYDYGTDTKIVSSDAVGPDRTELAMLRAVLVPNMGIRSYLFIARIPSADKAKIAAYRAKTQQWINEITAIDAAPVAP